MKKTIIFLFSFILSQNPISDAGSDQVIQLGSQVQLDGSASYDTDGAISSYSWTSNNGITLSGSDTATPSFTAPNEASTLSFTLDVTDNNGNTSPSNSASDIFISEYHDGGSPNQYLEIFNGTDSAIDLAGYELWILKSESDMTWEPIYSTEDEEWETDFWVLVFNSDTSMTNINSNLQLDGDYMQRVDPGLLNPNESLMIIREGEGEDFDFIGRNYVVWDRLVKISGDEPVALLKNGQIIDKLGDDENVGNSGWDVGEGTTRDHTLIRKSTVVSGNTDWVSSALSEWDVFDRDTFNDIFNHNCTSCDNEVIIYVSSPPVASPSYVLDDLLLDTNGDICDTQVTLDASPSNTETGNITYQWIDTNGLIDESDLNRKQPSFSTIGVAAGTYQFGLVVFDGLLESTEATVSITIGDNLCPLASSSVVLESENSWVEQYPSLVYFESENFTDEGDGVWNEGEVFYDIGDFTYSEGEDYIDVNSNGQWDASEPFVDMGDGQYTCNDIGWSVGEACIDGEQFDDIGNQAYTFGENFIDINGNGIWDDSQKVYVSGLSSSDPDGGSLSYAWNEISGHLSSDSIVYEEEDGSVISFIRPDFNGDMNGQVEFTLFVSDGQNISTQDTLIIKFGKPSKPLSPILSTRTEHQKVILSWDSSAESSEDYLTGYYDFEGYRLYKSTDGGDTWGTDSDKIYDDTGAFAGWKPFRQWDYTQSEDESRCNFSEGFCTENNRGIDVSGYDPYSYWINIGENSGLVYSFVDTSVVDGVEYTYALTSYDTGIWTTYQDQATGETLWYESNPTQFIDIDGNGFTTLESDREDNMITVTPGYYAGDINFPDPSDTEIIFTSGESNYGNALVEYELVNIDDLEPTSIKFEIQAEEENYNNFEGLSTKNPTLYAYYVDNLTQLPLSTTDIPYAPLLNSERDSLLDLPGTYLDESNNMIVQPDYALESMEILYVDDIGQDLNWSDFLSGTRMKFTNPWREYGQSYYILNISDLDNIIYYEGPGAEYYAPIIGETFVPSNDDEQLSRRINYSLKYDSPTTFNNRPPYRYKIEFSKEAEYEALEVQQDGGANADFSCQNSDRNTLLPFRVYNMTTERYVGLRHIDRGFNNGGSADDPLYGPASGCEPEGTDDFVGDCDCVWTMYEDVVFVEDTVTTKFNTTPHPETTYSLELSYDFFVLINFLNADPWNENFAYDEGKFVIYGQTKWQAMTDVNPGVTPGAPYDPDGDGVDNGNPWKAVYPWSNFDSDNIELIIEPWTWFADGDNWVADLSQLGVKTAIDEDMLEEVTVSPNPYMRHSGYNESSGKHKLRFSKLPTECEINIFTVSGERVKTIQFQNSDGYYGNYFWDQKNANGDLVSPGLYIYTIEDKNYKHKHIGKFAIVR